MSTPATLQTRHLPASLVGGVIMAHLLTSTIFAQMLDRSATRAETDLKIGWKRADCHPRPRPDSIRTLAAEHEAVAIDRVGWVEARDPHP